MKKDLREYATPEEMIVIERQKEIEYNINYFSIYDSDYFDMHYKCILRADTVEEVEKINNEQSKKRRSRNYEIEEINKKIKELQDVVKQLEQKNEDSYIIEKILNRAVEERKQEIENIEYEKFIDVYKKYSAYENKTYIQFQLCSMEKGNPKNCTILFLIKSIPFKNRKNIEEILKEETEFYKTNKIRDCHNLLNMKLREAYELVS